MKSFQNIISNLSKSREFKRLDSTIIMRKVINFLPHNLRKSTLFATIKGETLLFAMKHPSSVSEINNYKKSIILGIIRQMQEQMRLQNLSSGEPINAEFAAINNIRAYIPTHILKEQKFKPQTIVIECYKERANGEFIIDKNHKFAKEFEQIRRIIKSQNSNFSGEIDTDTPQ